MRCGLFLLLPRSNLVRKGAPVLKFGNLSIANHPQSNGRLRAVTLVRVSTSEQAAEGRSGPERQRLSNEAVIKATGYDVVEAIEIIDVSGTNSFDCSEMRRLVYMIETRQVDVVVVSEMSRIFRPDSLESFGSLDVFKRNGVLLNCGGTIHDMASPEGFLSSGIMSLLGGYERLSMLRKMLQSKEASRANGFCPSAAITLPLGLEYNRSTNLFRYGPEIWKIQEAFRLVDEEGIRNFSEIGRRVCIHHRTLKNLLGNPYVIGIRSYTKMRDPNRKGVKAGGRQGDRPKISRPPEQVISVRIIPPEQQAVADDRFERVQLFLAEMADRHVRFVAPFKGINLLTGIGFCGCCSERIYTSNRSKRSPNKEKSRGYYLCKSHFYLFKDKMQKCSQAWMTREAMDALLSEFVVRFLQDEIFISAILKHAQAKQRPSVVALDSMPSQIRQQISALENKDKRLLDAIEEGVLSLAEAKQRRQRLEEEKHRLLLTLQGAEQGASDPSLPQGVIGRIAAKGLNAWTSIQCPRERKKFIATLFMEIYVKGESITAFRLAPSLVGKDSGEWAWVADIPVTLPEPFRVSPIKPTVELPKDHRRCSRCEMILPYAEFYGQRPACKTCEKTANNARYAAKKATRQIS